MSAKRLKGLRARYEGMSDEALEEIVNQRSGEYTMEARKLAQDVLSGRGVAVDIDPEALPPPPDQSSADRKASPLVTSAVLAAIWIPVIYWSIDAASQGDVGTIIFFVVAAGLLTPLAFWMGRMPMRGA